MSDSRWNVGRRRAPAITRNLLAATLGAVLGLALIAPVQSATHHLNRASITRGNKGLQNTNAQVEVFVRLSTPSVAELNAQSVAATGDLASDLAQAAQVAAIHAE